MDMDSKLAAAVERLTNALDVLSDALDSMSNDCSDEKKTTEDVFQPWSSRTATVSVTSSVAELEAENERLKKDIFEIRGQRERAREAIFEAARTVDQDRRKSNPRYFQFNI